MGQSDARSPADMGRPHRVAIIGVHGVARHEPGDTANAMAELLLSLPSFNPEHADTPFEKRKPREFDYFDSKGIQISLQPVCIEKRVEAERNQVIPGPFRLQEGSYKFALHLSKELEVGKQRGEIGRQWSIKLLQDYYGAADGNKYATTRLDGRRADSTEAHIYEMFWADLARPTSSVVSFFLAVFQLILHLPSLSRLAIDSRPNPDKVWKIFQSLQRYASRILQMVLPLAKVMLLIVLLTAIPAVKNVEQLGLFSAVVATIVVAVLTFLVMNYQLKPIFTRRATWLVTSFLPALAILISILYIVGREQNYPTKSVEIVVLSISLWILGAGLIWWVLNAYQTTRPGIQGWGWVFYAAASVVFAIFAYRASRLPGESDQIALSIQRASFWTAQWLLVFIRVSWITLAFLAILASIVGAIACHRGGSESDKSKARAAVRTSRFALAMPAFLFVVVTSFIWAGLFSIADKVHNPFFEQRVINDPAPHPHWRRLRYLDLYPGSSVADSFTGNCDAPKPACSGGQKDSPSRGDVNQPDYLKGVLAWSLGSGSYIVVLITLLGLTILIWWALPSVLTEKFPPRRGYDWYTTHHTEPPRNSTNAEAMWMGGWISRGLDSISVVTWLTWFAIFLIPLAFLYIGPPHLWSLRAHSQYVMTLVVCRVIAVASTTAVFVALVHYSSPVLRVILDVDTYLRTGPIEATPRAKIFERYVSLLRHIAQYQDTDGNGYDKVVIVAHSLGALISGDLLNLLEHQKNDPALQKLGFWQTHDNLKVPIILFTMGNPVRQLLNRFFPYLYDWVRDNPDNGTMPLGRPLKQPPADIDSSLPDPKDLGVEKWISGYRSGDYVGRSLWLNEWYRRTATSDKDGIYPEIMTKISSKDHTRVEFCIGAGAHTHYWDDTAPDIASQLNEIIGP